MSEPILISPLLDGFAIGTPIRDHNGIRCCPAVKENTDKKYIVKIIAIPASQVQMDALLLAGAYKDPSDAMDYFREKGEEILKEAELLKKLSKLDGFLSYEGWQMEPITRHRLGYEVYLLGSYKRSLERYIRHNAITHLEAINLGLDLCNALSICRQAGALYVDLKPANIFISDKKEYRIGDLGFFDMDALRYTALPERYLSSYTPPELYDPMATVNLTADTYALGMILYQLYNDGSLPFKGKAPEEELPSPVHADYELADIIMRAIHPDPDQRWTDPAEMGKALASYMQRNTVNDVAITPLRIKKTKKHKKIADTEESSVIQTEQTAEIPVSDLPMENSEELHTAEPPIVEAAHEPEPAPVSEPDSLPETPSEEINDTKSTSTEFNAETSVDAPSEETEITPEENAIEEKFAEEKPVVLSEELSRIMERADDLIAHEMPEEVQLPSAPEVADPFSFVLDEEDIDDSDIPYDPLMEDEEPSEKAERKKHSKKFVDPKYKQRRQRFSILLLSILILALIGCGMFWYYKNIFLQPIEKLTITGDRNQILVQVDSPVDESKLSVTCLDNYGNTKTISVQNGQAVFTGLHPNTMYTIRVDIDGFHGLVGKTSDIFTTEATTMIVSFTSVAGAEDGSVVLSFTVDGDEPDHWVVNYVAEGETELHKTFTGHSVTITGLSLGKTYTFTLEAGNRLSLGGNTTLDLMATRLILAEDIHVVSSDESGITIRWSTPGDVVVDYWDVHCYNDRGYDQTVTVKEAVVTFTEIDPSTEYTVEVTAAGMTQPARTGITANPINIRTLNVDDTNPEKLLVSWDFDGKAPDGGWLLLYTIDGSENHVVKCTKPSGEITPKIPGAKYHFTIQSADGTTIFNNIHTSTTVDAQPYDANKLKTDMLDIDLLKTPAEENWYCENISSDQFTNQFQVGDSISIALRSNDSFYLPGSRTTVLYVIRDSYGNVLPDTKAEEIVWKNIWTGGDSKNGELNLPSVPTSTGNYVLSLYFDGMFVEELPFTIS